MALPCGTYTVSIPGTGFNMVEVPGYVGSTYKNDTDKLLYEIWQTLLLILIALGGIPVTKIITFTIGDGQADTPANGTTSIELPAMQGQNIFNVNLLVIREGIELKYSSAVTVNDIRRYNHSGNGGFVFEGASGLSFQTGESYDIYIVGTNTTDQV